MAPSRVLATSLLLARGSMLAAADFTARADATATTGSSGTHTNTGTLAVTGTTLPEIVRETVPCALLCYNAACVDSGCHAADFECVCANPNSLVVKMGICAGTECDGSQQFNAGDWVADMCNVYGNNPQSADISSASAILVSEISSVSATATDNPVPSTASISIDATVAGSAASSSSTAPSSGSNGLFKTWTPIIAGLWGGAAGIVAALF